MWMHQLNLNFLGFLLCAVEVLSDTTAEDCCSVWFTKETVLASECNASTMPASLIYPSLVPGTLERRILNQ